MENLSTRAQKNADHFNEELVHQDLTLSRTVDHLQTRISQLEQEKSELKNAENSETRQLIGILQAQLSDSEAKNRQLQSYLSTLKESYMSTFGRKNSA